MKRLLSSERHDGTVIDRNVGSRLRARRMECNISEETFSSVLSIAPDLLPAWETGAPRIPAVMMTEIAHLLSVDFMYFFEGLEDVDGQIVSASLPPQPLC